MNVHTLPSDVESFVPHRDSMLLLDKLQKVELDTGQAEVTVRSSNIFYENRKYTFDFEDFEEKAKDPLTKIFILCSPHNPVGRVWTREDLKKLGDICLEHDILIISDEIHHDLVLPGNKHTVFSTISEEFEQKTMIPQKRKRITFFDLRK